MLVSLVRRIMALHHGSLSLNESGIIVCPYSFIIRTYTLLRSQIRSIIMGLIHTHLDGAEPTKGDIVIRTN